MATIAETLQHLSALPEWLAAPTQPKLVVAALERHVPAFASGELVIQRCKTKRLRLKGRAWEALYALTVADANDQAGHEVMLAGELTPLGIERADQASGGVFGDRAWRAYLPELRLDVWITFEDEALETLTILSDAEQSRVLLEESIRACSPNYAQICIERARPKVARYKAGSRATMIYNLEYADRSPAWPDMVVVKIYGKDKGRNAYEAMHKLWASSLAKGDIVSIAEPLAYIPEHKMLIQGPVRGDQDLKDLLRLALRSGTPDALNELYAVIRKTSAGLAALHHCGARHGETITWADEVAEIRKEIVKLNATLPLFADATMPLLTRLEALAATAPPAPDLPSHGSFRPQQVLVHQGNIGFIDFDGFGLAEPALDIALFCATIKEMGINTAPSDKQKEFEYPSDEARAARLEQLNTICEVFVSEYERHAPISRQRVALWEALDLLTVVLRCWSKVKAHQLDNAIVLLEAHLRDIEME